MVLKTRFHRSSSPDCSRRREGKHPHLHCFQCQHVTRAFPRLHVFKFPTETTLRRFVEFAFGQPQSCSNVFICDRRSTETLDEQGPVQRGVRTRLQLKGGSVPTILSHKLAVKPMIPATTPSRTATVAATTAA